MRHAGWNELLAGLRSGVLALIFAGLTGYLMLVLNHAGYLRQMGASDIPRNAPSLVYLMTSGDTFFLLFAWAWVFSQPIVRDRNAHLHEIVLAAPVSLQGLLLGRFLGVTAVAAILGASQIAGFLLAPGLEWAGTVPAGSMGRTPWVALGWAWLVLTLPSALGCGALYMIAGLRTRSVAGPFAAAATLMMCWVITKVAFKEGGMDPFWSAMLDPSGLVEVETQVMDWTPREKSTSLLALTPALIVNRALWCLLPLCWLAWTLRRVRREHLVSERSVRLAKADSPESPPPQPVTARSAAPDVPSNWLRATAAETAWQCRQAIAPKGVWIAVAGLVVIGVASAFAHSVGHADGPMVPRPELLSPLMLKMMYLLTTFVVAGAAGMALRRDNTPGFGEMFDAAPAPDAIRLGGRVGAIIGLTVLFALVPAVAALLITAMAAPYSFDALVAIGYQLLVALPALLEVAAVMVLMHALIRPAGPAYAASMLATFIFIVNYEAKVISYPPAVIGIPVQLAFSGLTGWAPWGERLLGNDAWKLALATLMLAVAGIAMPRGTDGRWRVAWKQARRRLWGPIGAAGLAALVAMGILGPWQQQRFVDEGGYRSWEGTLADDAAWERRWLSQAGEFSMAGGSIDITLAPNLRRVMGVWKLQDVHAAGGRLHLETPHGFNRLEAKVNGQPAGTEFAQDHAAVELGQACAGHGCSVTLQWQIDVRGWDAEGAPAWMLQQGAWARAMDLAPRLGFDRNRILLAPADRKILGLPAEVPPLPAASAVPADGIAPAALWRWSVRIGDNLLATGEGAGPLDFAVVWAPKAETTVVGSYAITHDHTRHATALSVAEDLDAMSQCVARRTGHAPNVDAVAQLPRRLGGVAVVGRTLMLPEDPGWDVADKGRGRWLRRASIAAALARRDITDRAQLRDSNGSQVLAQGLAGAIGLLCVGDADGIGALSALLDHGADAATQALAASKVPVGMTEQAQADGWYAHYGPLAMLTHAATLTPGQYEALLEEVAIDGDPAVALRKVYPRQADYILGAPRSADLHLSIMARGQARVNGKSWRWKDGGWAAYGDAPAAMLFVHAATGLKPVANAKQISADRASSGLIAVPQFAYERSPRDNVIAAKVNMDF